MASGVRVGIRMQGLSRSSGGLEFRVQGLGCRTTFTERTADHFEANIMAQVDPPPSNSDYYG